MGNTITHVGNDMADAIREELRAALLAVYGTLEAAASALDMPYKTLYRHLTPTGKDRTARVSLDFVLDVTDNLAAARGIDLAEIHRRAQLSANVPDAHEDDYEVTPQGPQSSFGLAAKRGRKKADIPHAE